MASKYKLTSTFDSISELFKGKVETFLINKIELDESFPSIPFVCLVINLQEKVQTNLRVELLFIINEQLPSRPIKN